MAGGTGWGALPHPDHLRLGETVITRVDHPDAASFTDGEPTLGWEGDSRLALYADTKADRWLLVRLEDDGVYRPCRASTPGQRLGRAWVNEVITSLVSTDVRRGFDVYEVTTAAEVAREAAMAADDRDFMENDLADRMDWAVRKGWNERGKFGYEGSSE